MQRTETYILRISLWQTLAFYFWSVHNLKILIYLPQVYSTSYFALFCICSSGWERTGGCNEDLSSLTIWNQSFGEKQNHCRNHVCESSGEKWQKRNKQRWYNQHPICTTFVCYHIFCNLLDYFCSLLVIAEWLFHCNHNSTLKML